MIGFITSQGLSWKGVLKSIPKSTNSMQPIFEAITNSLESIDIRKRRGDVFSPYINLKFFFNETLDHEPDGLLRVEISDNGIGFDNINFSRLEIFKDDTKGYGNRGSGRIQLIHSFHNATYTSVYLQDNTPMMRQFTLSKSDCFLANNSIIKVDREEKIEGTEDLRTVLELCNLRTKFDIKFFNDQTIDNIKEIILNHYIQYFCTNKDSLPQINISYFHQDQLIQERTIVVSDIPTVSHNDETVMVPISKISDDMKRVEDSEDPDSQVKINVKSYKLPLDQIKKNTVKVTCKGEVVDSVKVKLECLPSDMQIDSSHFLFVLSSPYFDERIGDNRDTLEILNKTEFKKKAKQFGTIQPQIVMDNLERKLSDKASEMYSEIASQKKQQEEQLVRLKKIYLLSDDAIKDANINDSVEDILKKAYTYDAKLIAERDAVYHAKQEELNSLDTTSPSYQEDLYRLVEDISRVLPLQDKETLSRYVTHRRLVLDLMSKILNREIDIQKVEGARNEDEKLLHNLLFAQHSDNTRESDLWMLNEDYLYFKGFSEHRLNQIEIDGVKLFKENITEEEERYLVSLGENRKIKRPDILLFPSERKCIIVELKTPTTNLSLHLDQIKKYAYFLLNFTSEQFTIDTFYGYLIGEALEFRDVRAADGRFKYDPKFNFMYLPNAPVVFEDDHTGKQDGSLYMEVLTYSVLLERAKKRNEAFTSILFPKETEDSLQDCSPQENQEIGTNEKTIFD